MTWMDALKIALQLLGLPILYGIAKVLTRLNDLSLLHAVQDEKLKTLRDDFHEHRKEDATAFANAQTQVGGLNVRVQGLAERIAGALGVIGRGSDRSSATTSEE